MQDIGRVDVGEDRLVRRLEARVALELGADGSHDIGHMRRVCRLALEISDSEGGEREILIAAAYLHDLVNLPKNDPARAQASRRSAVAARPILAEFGFDGPRQEAIAHVIEAHSFSAAIAPRSLEAEILQDADRLDALGAIGIARCFYVSGRMGSLLFDPEDPQAERRDKDDTAYALDHFETKLYPVAEGLRTAAGRRIGAARLAVMQRFVADLLQDIDPDRA